MKSGKRHMTDWMEQPNHHKIRMLEENETYKYLLSRRLTPSEKNMSGEWKTKETKFSSRNLIKGIDTWAVPLVRYSGPFLKWTRDELKQIDKRTRN